MKGKHGVMVNKLDSQTIIVELICQWVPYSSGFVAQLS